MQLVNLFISFGLLSLQNSQFCNIFLSARSDALEVVPFVNGKYKRELYVCWLSATLASYDVNNSFIQYVTLGLGI